MSNRSGILNIPDFWMQPDREWLNITKYDFCYYYQSGCTATKSEAHQAYSEDIIFMLKDDKINGNELKALKTCQTNLKNANINDANTYFWEHEANKISRLVSKELFAEKEFEIMKKITAVTTLRLYNQELSSSLSSSSSSLSSATQSIQQAVSVDRLVDINTDKNLSVKRKNKEDVSETVQAKRFNKQETYNDKFISYKQKIIHDAATKLEFSLEANLNELIALNNIMLLKPLQYGRYTRDHFTDEVLNEWHKSILSSLIVDVEQEAKDIYNSLNEVIYNLQKKKIKTREAVQELVEMSVEKEDYIAQILIGLSNLVQKLPSQNLLCTTAICEAELWSSVFDPILTALFSDPDRGTLLRCEGSTSEIIHVHSDAMMCTFDKPDLGCKLGYGEAKIADSNHNTRVLANDLLRLASMATKTIGESKTRSILSFQIHGYNFKAYISQKMPNCSFYTMIEVLEITFPRSIQEIDCFTSRKNIESLISLFKIFWEIVA